jgi:ubiquinone/menaquinone biosynthesis C-methylase UbiE
MIDSPHHTHREKISQQQVAADFDSLADSYEDKINSAIAFVGREHGFYVDVKRDHLLRLASSQFQDLRAIDVLDLGCGIGAYHRGLEGRFRELHGIDVSAQSIDVARHKYPFVSYQSFDGGKLPYPDDRFDLVFTICVMHHVPTAQWETFTAEMFRVVKLGGLALVFEHNPYNPATQYIVKSCDIDKDAVLLAPGKLRRLFGLAGFEQLQTRSILSVPPVNGPLVQIDRLFGYLPLGAQYYLSGVKRR